MLDFSNMVPKMHYFIHRKPTPGWRIIREEIHFHDLSYIVKGEAIYRIDGEPVMVKAGDLIYIPKGKVREAVTTEADPVESYAVNFILEEEGENTWILPFDTITKIDYQPELIRLLERINSAWLDKSYGYELLVRGFLCQYLYQALRLTSKEYDYRCADARVNDAQQYMLRHYREKLTVTQMATRYHLHPNYFGSLFASQTGISFNQMLLRIRLNAAEIMLMSGEYSVETTANECGFSDIFYFSRLFKREKGVPPSKIIPNYSGEEI